MGREKLNANVNISFITILMVIGGFGLIIIGNLPFYDSIGWVKVAKKIVEALGTTIFSAGLVSVVVEVSTISQVVKKALMGILMDKFPFEKLSKERLDEIFKQVAFLRVNDERVKESDVADSPYVLESELLDLSKGLYYEYHKAKYIITPDDANGMFKKRVEFDYKIINKFKHENSARITISLVCKRDSLSKDELKSYFDIKLFKIEESEKIKTTGRRANEKNLTNEAKDFWDVIDVEEHEHSLYRYKIHFEYPLDSNKLTNRILLIYEYQIPQSDIIQSYKLNYPSRSLEHEITMSGNEWEVTGDAYTAFYYPSMYDKEYTVAQSIPTSIRVDFREWAVPGAGYMITFLKK